jgi:hypothetical protein
LRAWIGAFADGLDRLTGDISGREQIDPIVDLAEEPVPAQPDLLTSLAGLSGRLPDNATPRATGNQRPLSVESSDAVACD